MSNQDNLTETEQSYVLLKLEDTLYGISNRYVQHVDVPDKVTPVPGTPDFVAGITLSRGHMIPVINLRIRFALDKIEHRLGARLVVVAVGERSVGLVVDSAREFLTIPAAAIQPPPKYISGLIERYLQGVALLDRRMILILDMEALLALEPTA